MRNISDKIVQNIKTCFMFSSFFFFRKSCHFFRYCEKIW